MASRSSSTSDSSDSEAGEDQMQVQSKEDGQGDPACGQYGSTESSDNEGFVSRLRAQVQLEQTQPGGTQSQDPDTVVAVCTTAIGPCQPSLEEEGITSEEAHQVVISAQEVSVQREDGALATSATPAAEAFGMNIGATSPHSDQMEASVMLPVVGQQESAVDAMPTAVPQLPARRPTEQLRTAIIERICHIMREMSRLQSIDSKGRGSSVGIDEDVVAEELDQNGDVDLRQARHIRQNEHMQKMCVSCWEQEKEVTLVPCEHECLCYRCFIDPGFSLHDPRQCPVCHHIFDECRFTPRLMAEVLHRSQMP